MSASGRALGVAQHVRQGLESDALWVFDPRADTPGWIHAVEAGGAVDGPGFRFVLLLAGCQLSCLCCHNPDSWHMQMRWPPQDSSRSA